jgi:hypothetical protein
MKMPVRRPEPGARSKHVDMRYFKIKELADRNVVHLVHEGTETMVADILTKPLGPEKFHPRPARTGVPPAWTKKRAKRIKTRTTQDSQSYEQTQNYSVLKSLAGEAGRQGYRQR